MKILIDTNIVLDVLLNRKPFSKHSAEVFKLAEQGCIKAYLTSNSVTDIVYILRKTYNKEAIKKNLLIMFGFIKILNVSARDIINAFNIDTSDYEDAVVIQCASRIKADFIVTRNLDDFKLSPVRYVSAEEFISFFFEQHKN
jgi:predicted nucleic acid-binding protein